MWNHRIPSYPSSEKLHVEHLERKYPRRFSQDLGCISSLSVVACVSCGTPIHTKSKAQKSWGITQAVCAQHTSSNSMFTMFDMIECFVSFYGNVDTKSQLDHSWTRNESCLGRITYNDKRWTTTKLIILRLTKQGPIAKCCHTWHPHFTSLVDRAERSKRGTYLQYPPPIDLSLEKEWQKQHIENLRLYCVDASGCRFERICSESEMYLSRPSGYLQTLTTQPGDRSVHQLL